MDRVDSYIIHHNPAQAWNTFANEISALENDLTIMRNNEKTLGKMPSDIKNRLWRLWMKLGEDL